MTDSKPPPLPPRHPRPAPITEPFRLLDTPPLGTPRAARPIETLADLGGELASVRRELAALRGSLPPPSGPTVTPTPIPPSRRSRPAAVALGAWKGTQWLGVATLVLTLAAQVAALLKPGLVGPIQRAADALEVLAR